MKKLIILLLLTATCESTVVERTHQEQTVNFHGDISEVEYKGHSYIVFRYCGPGYDGIGLGVMHDPDCYCMK